MTEILSSIEEVVTHTEETWEALAHSGIAEVIPGVGVAIKVWRGAHKAADALLAAKLLAFIRDPSLQKPDTRAKMREQAESPESKKIGETLFLVLDRLTDMQKPLWLAKVYAAYLDGELKSTDLRRLASAIDLAFGDDLIELINSPETLEDDSAAWKRNLVASGLIDALTTAPLNATRRTYFVSDYGRMFRKAVRDHS
jgi:hypothetical protein